MYKIDATQTIEKPIEQVFEFASRPETNQLWSGDKIERTPLPTGPGLVACTRIKVHSPIGVPLEVVEEMTEYTPGGGYASRIREVHGWVASQSSWRYTAVPRGTQVRVQHEVELHGWMRWLGPLFLWGARLKTRRDLERMKMLLEK